MQISNTKPPKFLTAAASSADIPLQDINTMIKLVIWKLFQLQMSISRAAKYLGSVALEFLVLCHWQSSWCATIQFWTMMTILLVLIFSKGLFYFHFFFLTDSSLFLYTGYNAIVPSLIPISECASPPLEVSLSHTIKVLFLCFRSLKLAAKIFIPCNPDHVLLRI